MNLLSIPKLGAEQASNTTLERFVNELSNPTSIWYDLKLAEMAGCDYVFVPDDICRQLNSTKSLQVFLKKIQTILGSPKSRTTIVSYWYDRYQLLHFERYSIRWHNGAVADVNKELLDGNAQLDFIRMLYDHSEPLIFTPAED